MTKEAEIRQMFEWIENHPDLGKVEVCIPNAGFSADKSLLDGSMEEWRSMLDVNVLSLNLCTQLAVKSMLKVTLLFPTHFHFFHSKFLFKRTKWMTDK